jgi:ascorbate-specific PTS system EIIC-type component UlaA
MKKLTFIKEFFLTGLITFVVAAVVSFLYSLLAHGSGRVDWETAVRLAIIFGVVLTWINLRR